MAGRMPGRSPDKANNEWGRVLQRIRLEAGLSRQAIGMPDKVERSFKRQEWILEHGSGILEGLKVEPRDLMMVALGTIDELEVVARSLGRLLEQSKREKR